MIQNITKHVSPNILTTQTRILDFMLTSQNMCIEYPPCSGKTVALIIAMLTHTFRSKNRRESTGDDRIIAILMLANEHVAISAYNMAKKLSEGTTIKLGLATHGNQIDINPLDIIIGTMNEVVRQSHAHWIPLTTDLKYLYVDNAEKLLTYELFWSLYDQILIKPTLVACSVKLKPKVHERLAKVDNIKYLSSFENVIKSNTRIMNIVCTDHKAKIDACKLVLSNLHNQQAVISVNVSNGFSEFFSFLLTQTF